MELAWVLLLTIACACKTSSGVPTVQTSLYRLLEDEPEFSLFKTLVDGAGAGIPDVFKSRKAPVTLLLPNNTAMERASRELGFQNATQMVSTQVHSGVARNLVHYHMILGVKLSSELLQAVKIKPLLVFGGDLELQFTTEGEIIDHHRKTSNARFTAVDTHANNAVLHQIDNLLIPGVDYAMSSESCTDVLFNNTPALQCTFESGSIFSQPTEWTAPGYLVTIQARANSGQDSPSAGKGGKAGTAQTTMSASFNGDNPLYLYVADTGELPVVFPNNGGAGGAPTFVTSSEWPLMTYNETVPESLVITAGGGGGGGSSSAAAGGDGGVAITTGPQHSWDNGKNGAGYSAAPPGGSKYDPSTNSVVGGCGFWVYATGTGTQFECAANMFSWTAGISSGQALCQAFSVLPPTVSSGSSIPMGYGLSLGPSGTAPTADECDKGAGGAGAGLAPAWAGMVYLGTASGGGGAASWARGSGDIEVPKEVQTWVDLEGDDGQPKVVLTYYPDPTSFAGDCSNATVDGRVVLQCVFKSSRTGVNTTELIESVYAHSGVPLNVSARMYVEAWGGRGGAGGTAINYGGIPCQANGGNGGGGGYSRVSHTTESFMALGEQIYIYVGSNGAAGPSESCACNQPQGKPGGGGTSTMLLTSELSSNLTIDDVVVLAAGGGGGGQGRCVLVPLHGGRGNAGGTAVSTENKPTESQSALGHLDGSGGSGACGIRSHFSDRCGSDGIGGRGGANPMGQVGWLGETIEWVHGEGGASRGDGHGGGAGGGGYGGGAAGPSGWFGKNFWIAHGGGGGGSYAAASSIEENNPPVGGASSPPGQHGGAVVITFDFNW